MPGQLIRRGERTWLVRIYLGLDAGGKRQYFNRTIHGTKRDAQKWLTATLRDRDLGGAVEPAMMPLNDYLDKWLNTIAKGAVRKTTFTGYTFYLGRYLRPSLGLRPLAKLGALEIQSVYNAMLEGGLSPRTIQYTNMILKQALQQAVKWRLLFHNPCDAVSVPRQVRREMQALSVEQVRRFLAVLGAIRHGVILELAVTTGLRPSEYLALKWSDFNAEAGTVKVERSLTRVPGGGWEFTENKTGRSRRTVKLHSGVIQSLLRHKQQQDVEREQAGEAWSEQGLMFTNESGGPVDHHNLARRQFREALKAAGLPRIRLYDLRHTAATLTLAAGGSAKVVQEMLGHANIALTLNVYAHLLPHMQEDAVARVELLLGGEASDGAQTGNRHTRRTQRVN